MDRNESAFLGVRTGTLIVQGRRRLVRRRTRNSCGRSSRDGIACQRLLARSGSGLPSPPPPPILLPAPRRFLNDELLTEAHATVR
jgi:hypothetical protein